jgi:hypothetical protein
MESSFFADKSSSGIALVIPAHNDDSVALNPVQFIDFFLISAIADRPYML